MRYLRKSNTHICCVAVLIALIFCLSAWATEDRQLNQLQACSSDMVAFWKFDEGEGSTAFDSVGLNHGTVIGASWTTGKVGGALHFDGNNDFVQLPNSVTPLNEFTIEAFINLTETMDEIQEIYSDYGVGFLVNVGGYLTLHRYIDKLGAKSVESEIVLNLVSWHHVVATYDGAHLRLFVDGNAASLPVPSMGQLDTPDPHAEVIGKVYSDKYYISGIIDQLTVYNKALSPEEIQDHYKNGWIESSNPACRDIIFESGFES